ncbi:MAG: hypothetical protein M1827_004559 [Pycnora praestabilis]|nr:MAG: hypothetical protein M1827_004559 [Pycnora praestabilis]
MMDSSIPEGKRPRLGSYAPPQSRMPHPSEPPTHNYPTQALPPPATSYHDSIPQDHRLAEADHQPHGYAHSGYTTPVPNARQYPPDSTFPRGDARSPIEAQQLSHSQYRPPPGYSRDPHHHSQPMDRPPPPPPSYAQEPNVSITHGMPTAGQHDGLPPNYTAPHNVIIPFPGSGPLGPSIPFSGTYPPKKKSIRASQACDACRGRKAKCDEGRPCSYCLEQSLECNYREIPPPRVDRSMALLTERTEGNSRSIESMNKKLDILLRWMYGQALPPRESTRSTSLEAPSQVLEEKQSFSEEPQTVMRELESPVDSRRQSIQGPPLPTLMSRIISQQPPYRPKPMERVNTLTEDDIKQEENGAFGGELSIPIEHTTAAQKLLRWPSIQELTQGANQNENYVMQGEEERGLLRVYGRGEGRDPADASQHRPASPSVSSEGDDQSFSNAGSPQEGLWGNGFNTLGVAEPQRYLHDPTGGLNTDGTLRLDHSTLHRLLKSYLANIHILHPFLDKNAITAMVTRFASRYNPGSVTRSPFAVATSVPMLDGRRDSAGTKRKRPNGVTSNAHASSSASATNAPPKIFPERSITSALVLLVLALGQITEHADPLPGLAEEIVLPSGMHSSSPYALQTESPPYSLKQSPGSSQSASSSFTSAASPIDAYRMGGSSRRASVDGLPIFQKRDDGLKNADVVPGLAYYAYATDILGNLHGGNELSHIQANLLAGLYAGQLARVLESWRWINSACTACQVIIRPAKFDLEKDEARKEMVIFAFWTCLQLESDILAELDLPHSGISRYEDTIPLPKGVTLSEHDAGQTTMGIYYSAQIQLRKILNRAHSALYAVDKSAKKPGWSSLTRDDLEFQLAQWRKGLPRGFSWEDDDPPAEDINAARMRAKYYGARYIINRPFLHHAIHPITSYRDHYTNNSLGAANGRMSQRGSPTLPAPMSAVDQSGRRKNNMAPPNGTSEGVNGKIREACEICIKSAIQSTVAFDNLGKRPIVTNIFGTAHAQFGNLLVLSATYRSDMQSLVPREKLENLLRRTISFLRRLAPVSPTLKTDTKILENVERVVFGANYVHESFSSFNGHGPSTSVRW